MSRERDDGDFRRLDNIREAGRALATARQRDMDETCRQMLAASRRVS